MIKKPIPRNIDTGLLAFLAIYNLPSGWAPYNIIVDRVLYFSTSLNPLTGLYIGDYLLASVLMIALAIRHRTPLPAVLASAPVFMYLAAELTGNIALLPLASVPMILSLYPVARRIGVIAILRALAAVILIFEALAVASALTYFATGARSPPIEYIVARERQLWALAEWMGIGLVITASIMWLTLKAIGRSHPLETENNNKNSEKITGERTPGILENPRIIIPVSIALVAILVILPHLPTVNPEGKPVSVDTYFYTGAMLRADKYGLEKGLKAYYPERPLHILALYHLYRLVGDPILLMDIIHPIASLSLLTISSYIVALRKHGPRAAGLTAILAASGHWTLAFISGGFQSNSLALGILLLLFALRGREILLAPAIMVLGGLIHPWTLAVVVPAYILYLARVERAGWRLILYVALSIVLILYTADQVSTSITGVSALERLNRVARVETIPQAIAGLPSIDAGDLLVYTVNIFRGFQVYTWGALTVAPILILASLSTRRSAATAFMAIAPIAMIPTISNPGLVFRIYLDIPLEIAAALALARVRDRLLIATVVTATLARALIFLMGHTPLEGELWERHIRI